MSETIQDLLREAGAHAAAGRLAAAVDAYRRVLARDPTNAAAHCDLGVALARRGQVNDAIAAYHRAIELAPQAAAGPYNLALLQQVAGRYGQAEASLRRALALEPGLAAAHGNLANCLEAQGRLEAAAESCRQALALRSDHLGDLVNLARLLTKLDQPDEALAALERALAVQPDFVPALVGRARLLKSAECARRAVALGPLDLDALRALHFVLGEAGGAEVEAAYQAALDRRPDFANGACDLAELRLARGDAGGALAACEACLSAVPGQTRALSLKTLALNALGEDQKLARLTSLDLLVHQRRWPETGQLNQALARHILAHPSLFHEPRETATRLGRHSGELLIEPKGPVAELERMIGRAVVAYQEEQRGNPFAVPPAPIPETWSLNVWAVVLEAAGYQEPHIHPSAWLSGVYYVALPEALAEAREQAGWLEFGRPLAHHRTRAAPDTTAVRPEEGLMVLFPSYFFHRTIPFAGAGTRISVAFDVIPERARR